MKISVQPVAATLDDTRWGVWIEDDSVALLVGTSKHSFDCDLAAERLAKGNLDIHDDAADPDAVVVMKEFMEMEERAAAAGVKPVVDHFPGDRVRIQMMFDSIKKNKK